MFPVRFRREFRQTKRIRILNREPLSETEVVLTLLVERDNGGGENVDMRVQRIGEEWKMAGHYERTAQAAQ